MAGWQGRRSMRISLCSGTVRICQFLQLFCQPFDVANLGEYPC